MCHRSTAEGCDLLLYTPMPRKVVLLTTHKPASPSLLLPSVRYFSKVGSSWFNITITQPFYPLSQKMPSVHQSSELVQHSPIYCGISRSWNILSPLTAKGDFGLLELERWDHLHNFSGMGTVAQTCCTVSQKLHSYLQNIPVHQFILGQVKRSAAYFSPTHR